ncbi:MAG: phage holin family protein [Fimbriimonas sp.]
MTRLLLRWVLLAVSVFAASLVAQAIGFGFKVETGTGEAIVTLLIGVAVLAFLNATLGKILKLLTLPLSCITLGLFSLVVNAFVLWLAASLELGFRITESGFRGFVAAFVASLLISFINGVLGVFLPDDKDD